MIPYYDADNTKLYHSDCLKLLETLPSDSVDLVFTSPPYNVGQTKVAKKESGPMYAEYADNLSQDDYYDLLNNTLRQCLRVCKGAVFFNLGYMSGNKKALHRWLNNNVDFLKEDIIWDKGPGASNTPIGNILLKRYENVYMFTADPKFEVNRYWENIGIKYRREFGKWISNLFVMPPDYENMKVARVHRAGFPVELPSMFIDIYTKKGDVVMDPFSGMGTTAKACQMMERSFIGSEMSKVYCDLTVERLKQTYLTV